MYVLWLGEHECDQRALIGGKAANLNRLHRVPPGFCPTTLAYDLAMARVHRSLKRGGRLLISSFIPDDERSSAVVPLLFAALELIVTTEGNTFTMKEYREWLLGAGFSSIATIDIPGAVSLIIANK